MKKLLAFLLMLNLMFMLFIPSGLGEGSYNLLPRNAWPEQLQQRNLTDEQIASLGNDYENLRMEISTFADYIAWVDSLGSTYYGHTTSNPYGQVNMSAEFNFQWAPATLGSNVLASMAQYMLEDDYPGMQMCLVLVVNGNQKNFVCGNIIPVEGGFLLINADNFSATCHENEKAMRVLGPIFAEDQAGILAYCNSISFDLIQTGGRLAQVLVMDKAENVVLDLDPSGRYVPQDATYVQEIYYDESAIYPPADAVLPMHAYGFPSDFNTTSSIGSAEALALHKGTLEDAADAINSIVDVMNYVYYSSYVAGDGDRSIPVRDNMEWHFNYKPEVVFQRHTGCCGATSGLICALLEGDYDQVGFVGITYEEGGGGGHVINYVQDGDTYYVFDVFAWAQSNYDSHGLRFCYASTLNEAVLKWAWQTGSYVKLMYTYTNPLGGDAPVGWDDSRVSHLFAGYGENVNIVMETPNEGYVYEFVEADPKLVEGIDLIRSVW